MQDYWHLIPCYDAKSDEADAIRRMFRDIVQDYSKVSVRVLSQGVLTLQVQAVSHQRVRQHEEQQRHSVDSTTCGQHSVPIPSVAAAGCGAAAPGLPSQSAF